MNRASLAVNAEHASIGSGGESDEPFGQPGARRTRSCCLVGVESPGYHSSHLARGGGPKGKRNGNYRHGRFTAEAVADRRVLSLLIREARDTVTALGSDRQV